MKKILVTGAAGFIGFHLASYLHGQNEHVVGIDNFNTYYDPQLKRDRAKLLHKKGINLVEGDIGDLDLIKKIIEQNEITHLVNLAAQAGVRYSLTNPQAYTKTNVQGFLNILEACRAFPEVKLIYASSSSVYGLNEKVPFSEKDRTDHQASLYGVTKKSNELMAAAYHHLYGISTIGLRFFTVYGPWGRPDMAYFSFTKAILAGQPLNLFNQGQMSRDFTYIDDIIQGVSSAISSEYTHEIFNLGNHEPVTLLRFVEVLENCLGKKAQKNMLPMQQGDVVNTYADIDHSQKKLNFFPKTSLEKGMPRFVDWYLDYYSQKMGE